MKYLMNDCSVDINGAWKDRSTNLLMQKDIDGNPCNLVVYRIDKMKDMSIEQVAMTAFEKSRSELQSLKLLGKGGGQVDGYPAFSIETSGTMQGHYIEQIIIFIDAPDQVISFTFSCPARISAATQQVVKEIFSSIKIGPKSHE